MPVAIWTGQSSGATREATTPPSGSAFQRWWATSVRHIVHISDPRIAASTPLSVVIQSLLVVTVHPINLRDPLHLRQVVEAVATVQEIIIVKDLSNTRGNDIT